MDDLISRLQEIVRDPVLYKDGAEQTRIAEEFLGENAYGYSHLVPPCASEEDVAKAEEELGFRLPALLKEVYTKVANGGFGPGYGILGIPPNGGTDDEGYNALTVGLSIETEDGEIDWPDALLPICYYGCNIYDCLDCSQENGAIYVWDAGEFRSVRGAASLRELLEDWLKDEEDYKSTSRARGNMLEN